MLFDVLGSTAQRLLRRSIRSNRRRSRRRPVSSGRSRGPRRGHPAHGCLPARPRSWRALPGRVIGQPAASPLLVARRQVVFAKRVRKYQRPLVATFRDHVLASRRTPAATPSACLRTLGLSAMNREDSVTAMLRIDSVTSSAPEQDLTRAACSLRAARPDSTSSASLLGQRPRGEPPA